jgi:hypothetical protein
MRDLGQKQAVESAKKHCPLPYGLRWATIRPICYTKENIMSIEKQTAAANIADIEILIVIDTDYVKSHYPQQPAQNEQSPDKVVGIDHSSQFMVCVDPRGINNVNNKTTQATADLNFNAKVKDSISIRGVSIYGNSDDAVIVYGIVHGGGDTVLNPFVTGAITRGQGVIPTKPNGVPATHGPVTVMGMNTIVQKIGTEHFLVNFGLYIVDPNHDDNQIFYGYFQWDPTITVPK